jgi:hypothetical protein
MIYLLTIKNYGMNANEKDLIFGIIYSELKKTSKELLAEILNVRLNELKDLRTKLPTEIDIIFCDHQIEKYTNLIAATESAIFDVPSEEEIEKQIINQYDYWVIGFKDGINFILNYKKNEADGK